MYEHHLLAALLLTGCKMHPISPRHGTRDRPGLQELIWDKQPGRGQWGLPVGSPGSPRFRRGVWWLSTWGRGPDALWSSLPAATIKDAPLPSFPIGIIYFGLGSMR